MKQAYFVHSYIDKSIKNLKNALYGTFWTGD